MCGICRWVGLVGLWVSSALDGNAQLRVLEGPTQGTTYSIKYLDTLSRNFQKEVDELFGQIDDALSIYDQGSEIAQFNRSGEHEFRSRHFYNVLKKAQETYINTNGLFDPTVMPLVEAYGFGPAKVDLSKAFRVDSLLQYVGFEKIRFDTLRVSAKKKNVRLDLNSIAQGYTVDVVAELLEKNGINSYLVEIGGELKSRGFKPDGSSWLVGISDPFQPRKLVAKIPLENRAMTTAGSYRNQHTIDGIIYTHIINPKTGEALQGEMLSVTLLAADAITADAYDTALMLMTLDEAKNFLQRHPELEAFLIYTDRQTGRTGQYMTEEFARIVK